MANAGGFLKESIWRDRDFRALPRTAQATYAELLSQKELDRAGMLPMQVTKWAKACDEITESDIWHDLKILEERRFALIDEDTDELFVRSYMRQSNVVSQPNLLKNALKCAGMVASDRLRHELAEELRRLHRSDATAVANEIDPGPMVEPIEKASGTHAEPIANPSETPNPSGTPREPRGVGEGEGEVTSVDGWVGGSRAREADSGATDLGPVRDVPPTPTATGDDPEPPTRCPRHLDDADPPACRACGQMRVAHESWTERNRFRRAAAASAAARARAAVAQAAIDACSMCDVDGYRGGRVCSHDPGEDDRIRRGLEKAREALTQAKASRS